MRVFWESRYVHLNAESAVPICIPRFSEEDRLSSI